MTFPPLDRHDQLALTRPWIFTGVGLESLRFGLRLGLEQVERELQLRRVDSLRLLPEQPPAQHVELVLEQLVLATRPLELLAEGGDEKPGFGQVARLGDGVGLARHCHTM